MTTINSVQVATIIKSQIPVRSLMCWGAHNFSATNEKLGGLIFKVNPNPKLRGGGYVKIVLNGLDLYDITILNNRKRIIYELENAYAEDLDEIFWKQLG
jgi:hypothetical protein